MRPLTLKCALCFTTVALGILTGCGWPTRSDYDGAPPAYDITAEIPNFEGVRAVDGFPNAAFQATFDETAVALAATEIPADGRRDFDMLVLSSGGVNGAFGAGVLTAWTKRGDRPDFWTVSGVSVGALMAPFAFAGPEFDDRLEELFRYIEPHSMHNEKSFLASVLWDESLLDNSPLRKMIARGVDEELLEAVAQKHEEGRRLYVGSTNLDIGHFVVWDLGKIATYRTPEALAMFRKVLAASASIPVVYPPTIFENEEGTELHADGAVIRPLFIPGNVFDGYKSAARAGLNWDDIDATMYVVHNGSLRPCASAVQRDTLAIAMRTVTMMSYTMVSEHVLQLYMLCQAWGAEFQFLTVPDGLELSVADFSSADTDKLFLLGRGFVEREKAWDDVPPGYVVRSDLKRIRPAATAIPDTPSTNLEPTTHELKTSARLDRIEAQLNAVLDSLNDR